MAQAQPMLDPPGPPKRRRWPRILLIFFIILAVAAAGLGIAGYMLYSKFDQISVVQAPTTSLGSNPESQPLNILLMGSDTRKGKGNNKYGLDAGRGGKRSDTTILLHISADRESALAVSIPRDLWVEQPACALAPGEFPYYAKFNNAFDAGGPACTTELVQEMTGVPVNHIAVVDFAGFKKVVDALGGVEVCLNEAVYDSAAELDLPAGRSVVSGEQALAFVRARKALGDGSDIGRMERQQAFLSSAIRKATDTGLLLNPARLYSVLDTATSALTVDQSLDELSEMRTLAESVNGIGPEKITFTTMPFSYRADNANLDPNIEKSQELWQAMINDTPWPAPPSVAPDGKKVTVPPEEIWVDLTAPRGKLEQAAAELRDAGFNVASRKAGKAPKKTAVVYPPSQRAAARTVAYAAGATMVSDVSAFAVRLTVGKDFESINPDIVIAKQSGGNKSASNGGKVTKADEELCSG